MTNNYNTVLYTGITNNLTRRTHKHKEKLIKGFTKRYNVDKLVYYEVFEEITEAITREKQIKGGPREKKVELINRTNKEWKDLYEDICGELLFTSLSVIARDFKSLEAISFTISRAFRYTALYTASTPNARKGGYTVGYPVSHRLGSRDIFHSCLCNPIYDR